jgi:cbb3-type cytochrome oxidase subunit 3
MDINLMREAVTVTSFVTFLGIVVYASWPANARRFDEAAMVPLQDDDPLPNPLPREREQTLDTVSRSGSIG